MTPIQHLESIDKRKRASQQIAFGLFSLLSYLIVAILFVIPGFTILEGASVTNWDFLTEVPREGMIFRGIFPVAVGTLYLVVGSSLISFPTSIMSGIYVNEYVTNGRLVHSIRTITNNLSGVPSVVFRLLGMSLFVSTLGWGDSIIADSFTLALMSLSLITHTTEETLKDIDDSFRHGSLVLGATKLRTIRRIMLPMMFPSIITGLILSIGRVSGETAPTPFMVTAHFLPQLPESIFNQCTVLPYRLHVISTSGTDIEASRGMAYGAALVLIVIALLVNLLANVLRSYFAKKVRMN